VVLDCCDNFEHPPGRQCRVRAARAAAGVRCAAIRFDGQLSVFDVRTPAQPCYACVFPPTMAFEETRCAVLGVFAPMVGIIGTLQAAEALKLLCGAGTPAAGRLLMLDGRSMEWSEVRVPRDPACPVCGPHRH
jgi:molybdopterin/thiamine biosynthesis adenylyltransferase